MKPSAKPSDHIFPARYYVLLLELVRSQGVALDPLLDSMGTDLTRLSEPDALLSLDQVDHLIEAVLAKTARSDLGFQLGRLVKPSNHELLGYALMTSATLDEALSLAASYWPLITPAFTLRYERDESDVRIHLRQAFALKPKTLQFHIEAVATAFHAEIAFLLSSRIPTYSIHLPETMVKAAPRYRQLAPARVQFDLDDNVGLRIELPAEMLSRPLALSDRNALKQARMRCDEALARLTRQGSLTDWIRMMMEQACDHQPRQQELAHFLHLSIRTLNRRLGAEGTSFREISQQTRHHRACQLLIDGNTPITRIGILLGYQDAANFTRAFRRSSGLSPAEFRKQAKR